MNKPVTGQYEYLHSSGIGLDYFTSRIDRLTLFPTGRFTLIVQDRSRLANAAQSLMSGQQPVASAPETRREGSYTAQGNMLAFRFDDGAQEQGQLSWNGDGMQFGPNFFTKVSDSTLLPPTHRLKKDMDDIAKGLKIAGTIGGMAMKAAKTLHETVQPAQEPGAGQGQQQARGPVPPAPAQATYAGAANPPGQPASPAPQHAEPVYCDQCGTLARPGKRYCSKCGAELPL